MCDGPFKIWGSGAADETAQWTSLAQRGDQLALQGSSSVHSYRISDCEAALHYIVAVFEVGRSVAAAAHSRQRTIRAHTWDAVADVRERVCFSLRYRRPVWAIDARDRWGPLCAAQSAANMSIVGMVCGTENISIGAGSHNTREQLGSEDSLSILPDEEHGGLG